MARSGDGGPSVVHSDGLRLPLAMVDAPERIFGTVDRRNPVYLGPWCGHGVAMEIGAMAKYQTCRSV